MKALILLSSPRRNSSFTLRIARTLLSALDITDFEIIYLADLKIEVCTGCLTCQKTGSCFIEDDVPFILEKMRTADLFLFASPVYLFSVSDLMKLFISRTVNYLHRDETLSGKPALITVTADGLGGENAIDYLKSYFSFTRLLFAGSLSCYIHEFKNYRKKNSRFQKELSKAVRCFRYFQKKRIYRPTLSDYHYYHIRKRFTIGGKKRIPQEFHYWETEGLLKRSYWKIPFPIKHSLLKQTAGILQAVFRIKGMF